MPGFIWKYAGVTLVTNLLVSPQGTSVLSPVLHIGSVIMLAMMIYKKSAVQLFERHPCLYILAFGFVAAKITNKLVVSCRLPACRGSMKLSVVLTGVLFTGRSYDQK